MAVTGSGEEPFLTWLNGDGAPADIDDPGLRRRRRRRGHCESYAQDSYSSASAHLGRPLMGETDLIPSAGSNVAVRSPQD